MQFVRLFFFTSVLVAGVSSVHAKEEPKNIIAAQVRDQGFECRAPKSAIRDPKASRPGEAVWLLRCESAAYRVRLIPHKAARIERLDVNE